MTKENIVVDSSAIVKWLSDEDEQYLKQADLILKDTERGRVKLFSPELAKYEVGNVMLQKEAPLAQIKAGTATVYKLPIQFVTETHEMSELTTEIAYESAMTYYDAAFLALARTLNGTLVTDNIKHQGKSKIVKVISIANYKSRLSP